MTRQDVQLFFLENRGICVPLNAIKIVTDNTFKIRCDDGERNFCWENGEVIELAWWDL